ncbi:hypothetical protein [Haematomicrobium sanguinis]|nr:hypothetical protein [Haematomicrobium sanguinis]
MKNIGAPTGIPFDGGNIAITIDADVENRGHFGVYSHAPLIT